MNLVVAFSGGKDSTAVALRLHQLGHKFRLLYTETGNELPDVRAHIEDVLIETRAPLIELNAPTLEELIEEQQCLPNWRMRWCTRMIKIEPVVRWLQLEENQGITLAVGLRADEEGRAGGDYSCAVWYPLREWDWGLHEVLRYLDRLGVTIPERTDCAVCFYQTLYEWWRLWKDYPDEYDKGEAWENFTGHTFRSPARDTHPAALSELRKEFEAGYQPTKRERKTMCRICSKGG